MKKHFFLTLLITLIGLNAFTQSDLYNEGSGGLVFQINQNLVVHSEGDVNNLTGANMTFESAGEPNLEFDGDFINSTSADLISGTGLIELTGSASQNLDFGGDDLYNLEIVNAAGGVFIRTAKVNNEVQFNIGDFITTNDSVLIFETSATAADATDDSHVNGPVVKNFNSTTEFIYPVGHGSSYNPAGFQPQGTSPTEMRVTYFWSPPLNPTLLEPQLKSISTVEEWDFTRLVGTEDGNVTLSWDEDSDIGALSEMVVAYWGGALWHDGGNTGTTSTPPNGTVKSDLVTMYDRMFTLGFSCGGEPSLTGVVGIDSTRCGDGSATLKVSNIPNTTTIDWYTDSIGGTLLVSGSNRNDTTFTTGILSADSSLYAELRDTITGCTSISRVQVNAVVNSKPDLTITDPAAVCAPNTIDLTATAVTAGSTTYGGTLTYFTDAGATSAYATPAAADSGAYFIVVTTGAGCTDTAQVNAVVNSKPDLTITDPAAVCAPNTIDLTASAITAGSTTYGGTLTYFTDAGATSAYATPAAADSNAYYIVVTTGAGCSDTAQVNAMVNSKPDLTITDPTAVCAPNTIDLTDAAVTAGSTTYGGTLTYFTDAGATSAYATPAAADSNAYYIVVTTGAGCSDTAQVNAVVNSKPSLTITDPAAVCSPNTIDLTAGAVTAGSSTYGGTLTYFTDPGATSAYTTPAVADSGAYFIVVTTGAGCSDTAQVNAVVNSKPDLTITDPTAVCAPNTIDLTASAITAGSTTYGGTLTYFTDAGATSAYATPAAADSNAYYIVVTTGAGCSDTAQVNAVVNSKPDLTITDPAAVCAPNTIDLTDAAVTAGSTTYGGTLTYFTDAGATSAYATPAAVDSNAYYIVVTTGAGCSDTAQVNAVVNSKPDLTITDPTAVCAPNTIDLTASAITAGSTTYGGTLTYFTDAGATSAYATPAAADSNAYYIVVTTGAGCSDTAQVNAVVNSKPDLTITDPAAVCAPNTIDLTAGAITAGSSTYGGTLTYFTDAGATSAYATPAAADSGAYFIVVTTGASCADTAQVNAVVNSKPSLTITDPVAVCAPNTIDLTNAAVTAGSTTYGGTLTYFTDAGATSAYATPAAADSNAYYIVVTTGAGCSDTAQVNAVVNSKPSLTITDPAAVCSPNTIDLTNAAVTAGSTTYGGTLTYFTDAGATSAYATPAAADSNAYYIVVTTGASCADTAQVNAVVNPTPTISSVAENSPSGCGLNDGSIIFSGLSSTTDYLLSYNSTVDSLVKSDASGDIKLLNLTSGNYINISIKGVVGSCSDATADITLLEPNIPLLDAGAAQVVCEGESVTLSATTNGGSTISWDNSVVDGVAFEPGVGAIKYTVTIDSSSCVTTDSVMVTVNGKPDLTITDPAAVCAPNTIDLTDAAVTAGSTTYGATFTYYTDAGATSAYTTPATANSGAYFIVASTGAGCSDTAQVNAFVKAGTFIASVTGGNPSGCGVNDGTITIGGLTASTNYLLSYNATVDSAVTSNSFGEIVLMNLSDGVYTGIDVRVSGGCFNDTKWEVTLASPDKPFVDAGVAQEVCEGEFVTLSATINPGTSVSWDNSVADGVAFQPGVGAIKYTVTADSSNCITIDSVTVTAHPKPNLTITNPATVCAPSTVDITATAITAGSSDLGTNTYYTDATLSALVTDATAVGAGTYSIVTETDENCRDTAVVNVTVGTGGSGTASATTNCDVREVDLSAMVSGPDVTFSQWLVSSDSINYSVSSSLDNFTAPAIQEAWYIAEFTSTDLCIGRDTIYVSACPKPLIAVSDVMTPNGDGDNDTFWITNIELYANNELIIYNRWGSEVYRASGYNNDWDGTFNGKPLPVGAYYYTLEFNGEEGTNIQGVINLMR